MTDPFLIDGPALISFSGGRTSAYMLYRIVQAHGGELPADVLVTFANTGKEMPQTLDFVNECGERWGVDIVWLEYADNDNPQLRWRVVNYNTASRNGEPFDALLKRKGYLPNPVARFCTIELKIRAMKFFAQQAQGWDDWTNVLGLRADEPVRVSRSRAQREVWENAMPLAEAGITKRDVQEFWNAQNFDLRLPNINGTTPGGNCDLCFLKSTANLQAIMRSAPDLAKWWIDAEATAAAANGKRDGSRFRKDRPSYAAMLDAVQRQQVFDFGDADQLIDCFCGEAA